MVKMKMSTRRMIVIMVANGRDDDSEKEWKDEDKVNAEEVHHNLEDEI